jgi:hypothetical protein
MGQAGAEGATGAEQPGLAGAESATMSLGEVFGGEGAVGRVRSTGVGADQRTGM